ncbi:MAG: HAMP domain-containing sensor histidine kinase [Cyclobacteriaceae bacterium]
MSGSPTMLAEASNRLRYEVLTKFATELGRAESYEDIRPLLTDNIKYMVNFMTARIILEVEEVSVIYEIHRSECTLIIGSGHCYNFEKRSMEDGLPCQYSREQMETKVGWENSIFAASRARGFFLFPQHTQPGHRALVVLATKDTSIFNDVDHRFIKLMSEMLISKISQLWYLNELDKKNKALNQTNHRLDQLYAEVNALNRNLESEVQVRTQELDESNRELREIFYRTSHDFRSPITSIRGLMNLARYESGDNLPLQTIYERCDENLERMDSMLGKLSKLSELNEEGMFEPSPICMEEITASIQKKFSTQLTTRTISWKADISAAQPCSRCLRQSTLESMLTYLVENAVTFYDNTIDDRCIEIKSRASRDSILITVSDNGKGIPEGLKGQVFDMYFRGDERSEGHGLGLYVVKKLIESCRGQVTLLPAGEYKTVFELRMPLQRAV